MPIRNAATPSADGTFSTDSGGCGGANNFGQNGKTTIVQGSTVTLHFNYGTGTNGDHPDPANQFVAAFINLDAGQKQADMFTPANQISSPVPAASGSTATGYTTTVKIPMQTCTQCVLSVYDQRHWGGCIDLSVIVALNASATPTWPLGWVPETSLAGYTVSNCVGPNFVWNNITTSTTSVVYTGGQSYCCPAGAVSCGGRCWMGDAPKTEKGNVQLFADGTLCSGNTICNGTQSMAYCSYTFKNNPTSKCTGNCDLCTSLCDTSASAGYADCACVGSDAVTQSLTLLLVVVATIVAIMF